MNAAVSYPAGQVRESAGKWRSPSFPAGAHKSAQRKKVQVRWMYDAQGKPDLPYLVEAYAPLVKRLAFQLLARLPASVEVDDLIQTGMLGLLDAIGRYEDGLGAQFETYAVQRIRGAMLDGLRDNDWMPRSVRRDMRRVEAAIQSLEHEHGRAPTEGELAVSLGMELAEYQKLLQDARGHQLMYFEDFGREQGEDFLDRHVVDAQTGPLDALLDADLRHRVVKAIEALPEREQMVMALYYDEELNLREIGAVLGVTESRVCQLHSQAVARLRASVLGLPADKPTRRRRTSAAGSRD